MFSAIKLVCLEYHLSTGIEPLHEVLNNLIQLLGCHMMTFIPKHGAGIGALQRAKLMDPIP